MAERVTKDDVEAIRKDEEAMGRYQVKEGRAVVSRERYNAPLARADKDAIDERCNTPQLSLLRHSSLTDCLVEKDLRRLRGRGGRVKR